jgi:hypothetical protein
MGEWRYSSTILDFGSRWRCVTIFVLQLFYSRGKSPRYLSNRRLGGTNNRFGRRVEEKSLLTSPTKDEELA